MRVIEVISCVSEGVDFKLLEKILRDLVEKPVYYHTALNATLRVADKNHSLDIRVIELPFEDRISGADVGCGVIEVALNQTFDEV